MQVRPAFLKRLHESQVYGRRESSHPFRQIMAAQGWDSAQLAVAVHQQWAHIRDHALRTVPFYREYAADQSEFENFPISRWPIITRQILQQNGTSLASLKPGPRPYQNASGGSTGQPVRIRQDRVYRQWARSVSALFDRWAGHSVGQRHLHLWGSDRDLRGTGPRILINLRRWAKNETWINAFTVNSQTIDELRIALGKDGATHCTAYVDAASAVAQLIETTGSQIPSAKGLIVSAGTLHDRDRPRIAAAFGTPPFNRYGSRETSDIACECSQHAGLHICPLTHIVEIVDSRGKPVQDGESGRILVTTLRNFTMPLIRYDIGDIGTLDRRPCPCGLAWPRLTSVEGRTIDMLRRPDGTTISPGAVIHAIGVMPQHESIERFQVIQETESQIRIRISPKSAKYQPNLEKSMRHVLAALIGDQNEIEFEYVDQILPSKSGKFRPVISKLNGNVEDDFLV